MPTTTILARLSTFVVFGTVVRGAVVCATNSSASCPNWPGCYDGQFTPEFQLNPIIEFVHRVFSMTCAPFVLVMGILLRKHHDRRVRLLPWVALAGALGAGIFGMFTILTGLSAVASMIDLWCALTALVCMVLTTRLLGATQFDATRSRIAGYAVVGVAALYGMGVLVAGDGSFTRCIGWPLGIIIDADHAAPLQILRVILAVALIGVFLWLRSLPVLFALAAELVLGVVIRTSGLTDLLGSLYGAVAVCIIALAAWQWGNYQYAAGA